MKTIASVAGIGVSRPTDGTPRPARVLRRDAIELALADAGLARGELDGYIGTSGLEDLRYLGLSPAFNISLNSGGASAAASIVSASSAMNLGLARHVAITFSLAPSASTMRTGDVAYGYPMLYGMFGPPSAHALHARRHMALYGTTSEQMGAVAVTQRNYAVDRPEAVGYGSPLTLEDHQASRMVVDPFRLYDCCRDVDIGVAVIVTTESVAADLASRPVHVVGAGLGHNIRHWHDGSVYEWHDDIVPAAAAAFAQTDLSLDDVDIAELYDPHTISVIMQLEHYGFCGPGEGGAYVEAGETGAKGSLPTNTGGGQLSGWYATGFTPLIEAVHQLRGTASAGLVPGAEVALVSGHGGNAGIQNTWAHATMLLVADR